MRRAARKVLATVVGALLLLLATSRGVPRAAMTTTTTTTTSVVHPAGRALLALSAGCREAVGAEDACAPGGPVESACGTSLLNYAKLHYCDLADLQWLSILIQVVLMIFLFICLGVAAESFFCPALNVISDSLKLSQNVAGVTFLALGNGAPDLFSSFAAVANGSFELAFGEVLGAAVFITTVCVGSVALIAPFTVTRRPFFRDVVLFLISLAFVLVVLWDGQVHLWEAFFLVGYYVFYVAIVVVSRAINRYLKRRNPNVFSTPKLTFAALAEGCYTLCCARSEESQQARDVKEPLLINSDVEGQQAPRAYQTSPVSFHEPAAEDHPGPAIVVTSEPEERPNTVHPVQIKSLTTAIEFLRVAEDPQHGGGRPRSASQRSNASVRSTASLVLFAAVARSQVHPHEHPHEHAHEHAHEHTAAASALQRPPSLTDGAPNPWLQVFMLLFPTLQDFLAKSVLSRVLAVLNTPAVFVLTLTVPVIAPEEEEASDAVTQGADKEQQERRRQSFDRPTDGAAAPASPAPKRSSKAAIVAATMATAPIVAAIDDYSPGVSAESFSETGQDEALLPEADVVVGPPEADDEGPAWNRPLYALQLLLSPVFIVFAAGLYATPIGTPNFQVWMLAFIVGAVLALAGWFTSSFERRPRYTTLLAYYSFLVSVLWIYLFANELVSLIQALGIIFNINETLLGLTVLAWGNSVGDFVANITVARMGFSNMAVGASFGGPMLNMLLGVGISCGYWVILNGQSFPVDLNDHLIVLLVSLFAILIFCLVYVPLNGYVGGRPLGIILLAMFVVSTVVNIVVEFI